MRVPVREDRARLTRARLAGIATPMFVARGYAATTVTDIARAAGVSPQTVYNAFGSKPALLKAAYDLALAEDADPVPMAERPDVLAVEQQTDPEAVLRGYARLARRALDRIGPLMLQVAAGAAAGDADLVAHQQVTDAERLVGTGQLAERIDALGALAPGVTPERARDWVWSLISVQLWQLLTRTLGWSGEDYEDWIGHALCSALLKGRPPVQPG